MVSAGSGQLVAGQARHLLAARRDHLDPLGPGPHLEVGLDDGPGRTHEQAAEICHGLGGRVDRRGGPGRRARAGTQQVDVRRRDHDRLGLVAGAQFRDAGPVGRAEAETGWVGRRPDRGSQLGVAWLQAAHPESPYSRPVADRDAFGDEDRPAHPAAQRPAHRDVERAQDGPRHARPEVDRPGLVDLPGDEGAAARGGPDIGVPADHRAGCVGQPQPRRLGVDGRAVGGGHSGERLAEQEAGAGVPLDDVPSGRPSATRS